MANEWWQTVENTFYKNKNKKITTFTSTKIRFNIKLQRIPLIGKIFTQNLSIKQDELARILTNNSNVTNILSDISFIQLHGHDILLKLRSQLKHNIQRGANVNAEKFYDKATNWMHTNFIDVHSMCCSCFDAMFAICAIYCSLFSWKYFHNIIIIIPSHRQLNEYGCYCSNVHSGIQYIYVNFSNTLHHFVVTVN